MAKGYVMPEPYHVFGQDLVLGANGDLLLVSDLSNNPVETTQRLLRRLFTNKGGYIWHLDYGAGLPSQVGLKAQAAAIAALVRSQIFQETTVAPQPPPSVNVSVNPSGTVICNITYTYVPTMQPVQLSFTLPISGNA